MPRWRVVGELLELTRGQGRLLSHTDVPWASITFAGTRHTVQFEFAGQTSVEAGEALIEALPDHEFCFPRVVVADVAVGEVQSLTGPPPILVVTVELLLLEEAR